LWFGDPHRKHLPVERGPSKNSIETHGAGGKADDCPPPPDLPSLFDSDWLDLLPPVVLAGAEMDGR
jgi:hypothetical protein